MARSSSFPTDEILTEQSHPSPDFLGTVCQEWEAAVGEGKALGLRVVIFRTGVVLTKEGGALASLVPMMGERSAFVLNSARAIPPEQLLQAYHYQYPTLDQALSAIYA